MIVQCPKCKEVSCPLSGVDESRPVEHVCPHCKKVIQINPGQGKGKPSSSVGTAEEAGRTGKILVVDDTATIRKIASEILKSSGYEVLTATDGPQALDIAHQEHPDLIVLDLVMPKMTGFEVIQAIRNAPRLQNTPVLIVTGIVPGQEVRANLRKYGVTDFITKNHLMTSLATRVPEILARQVDEAV